MNNIQDCSVEQKVVLLRADLNVPIKDGVVQDDSRIKRLGVTLQHLQSAGAKVVIVSHLGRPRGKEVKYSLQQLVAALAKVLKTDVLFIDDCVGEKVESAVSKLSAGQVMLLENLRFYAEEANNDLGFAKKLAAIADLYVNDAFSCSHRNHASIVGVTKFLPAFAGMALQDELNHLNRLLSFNKNADSSTNTAIIGGSKVSTKLDILLNLVEKVDNLVLGGAIANNFLQARGVFVGRSTLEKDVENLINKIRKAADNNGCEIILPIDAVVARSINSRVGIVKNVSYLAKNESILDIGPQTIDLIKQKISNSRIVVWNGPLGAFEHAPFSNGTFAVARYLADLTKMQKIISVAGGGDSVSALNAAGVNLSDLSYVSMAGGAFIQWFSNDKLPGIVALN